MISSANALKEHEETNDLFMYLTSAPGSVHRRYSMWALLQFGGKTSWSRRDSKFHQTLLENDFEKAIKFQVGKILSASLPPSSYPVIQIVVFVVERGRQIRNRKRRRKEKMKTKRRKRRRKKIKATNLYKCTRDSFHDWYLLSLDFSL